MQAAVIGALLRLVCRLLCLACNWATSSKIVRELCVVNAS